MNPWKANLNLQNLLSNSLGLDTNVNERALAPEPSFAYIRIDFNPDLSLELNLDPSLDLDSNMPMNVEMNLANANASARRVFGYAHANAINRSPLRLSPSSHPSPCARKRQLAGANRPWAPTGNINTWNLDLRFELASKHDCNRIITHLTVHLDSDFDLNVNLCLNSNVNLGLGLNLIWT